MTVTQEGKWDSKKTQDIEFKGLPLSLGAG